MKLFSILVFALLVLVVYSEFFNILVNKYNKKSMTKTDKETEKEDEHNRYTELLEYSREFDITDRKR